MEKKALAQKKSVFSKKIAVISDVHDNKINLKKVLNYCEREKIETVICCGDLASKETLDFFRANFFGKIYYTLGNAENDHSHISDYKNFSISKKTFIYEEFGEATIGDKKIAFTHFPREAEELCETGKYKLVFYGHTHKPWIEKNNNCTMLNPGNVTGTFYPPTFAVWNTENDKFNLIRVHGLN